MKHRNLDDLWWRNAWAEFPAVKRSIVFATNVGTFGGWRDDRGVYTDGDMCWSDLEVTHWMPMPEVPT